MKVAQSLMAGAGRSDPLMRPSGTMRGRGLQIPSDKSLGYSQGPLRGEISPKCLVWLFS
jgi:hypothetical protein